MPGNGTDGPDSARRAEEFSEKTASSKTWPTGCRTGLVRAWVAS